MSFLAYLFRTTFEMPIKSYAVSKSSTVIDFTFHVAFCDCPKEFKSFKSHRFKSELHLDGLKIFQAGKQSLTRSLCAFVYKFTYTSK